MKKKMLFVLVALMSFILTLSSVQAADLVKVNIYEEGYVLSETQGLDLPFVNEVVEKTVYDEDVNHSGITYSGNEIEILKHLKGIHLLISNDTVTIKGSVDYPLIIAGNVVIEGEITGDAVIYAPSVYIKESAKINGDLLISSNELEISGSVNGNVIAYVVNELKVTGIIGQSLRAEAGKVTLSEETINGNILLKTNSDTSEIVEKYPNATIEEIVVEETNNIQSMIFTGITTVILFTILGFVIVRKDNNIFEKLFNKIKTRISNVVLAGAALLLPAIAIIILLLILSLFGLWMVTVPLLVAYIAIIIVSCMLSVFIVGTVIFEAIKYNVIKNLENNLAIKKLGLLFLIYTVLYILTVIPFISSYVNIILCILSSGIVVMSCIKEKKK